MAPDVAQALEELRSIDEDALEPWRPLFDPLAFAR